MPSESNHEQIGATRADVYRDASHAATWGLGVNLLLVIIKCAGGIATHSTALIADAVNSVGDVASSLFVRGALWVAQQDEDDDHPYGHTKAETIAALTISILIVFTAGVLVIETIRNLTGKLDVPALAAVWIAAGCGIVKEVLYQYTNRIGQRIRSQALQGSAWDHRSDAICSIAIAFALWVAPLLGPWGVYVDPVAALSVCIVLLFVGFRLFRRSGRELMDQRADPEFSDAIRQQAQHLHEVHAIEKLRVRKSGLEYFVEIHVHVDGQLSVSEGHRIGHVVKDEILREFPRVRDVLVHIEPDQ